MTHLKRMEKIEKESAPAIPGSREGGQPDADSGKYEKGCATFEPNMGQILNGSHRLPMGRACPMVISDG